MMKRLAATVAVTVALVISPVWAEASTILVTSESGLTADGTIDWAQFGATVPSGSTATTGITGLTADVSETGTMTVLYQGTSWSGNFGSGESVLYTSTFFDGSLGPIVLDFSSPIAGAGAQIQANYFGGFTAQIDAYDALNNLLGSFQLAGDSTGAGDDSAIFIGILSSTANISRIVFGVPVTVFLPQDFAIGDVVVQTTPAPAPEPATLTLLALGTLGVVRRVRNRRTTL